MFPGERESITFINFWKKNPEATLLLLKRLHFCSSVYLRNYWQNTQKIRLLSLFSKIWKRWRKLQLASLIVSCKSEIWFKLRSYLNATLARDWSELGEHLELYLVLQKFLITFPSNQKTFGSKAILVLLINKNQHLTKVWIL